MIMMFTYRICIYLTFFLVKFIMVKWLEQNILMYNT